MKMFHEVFLLLYCSRWLLREGSLGAIHPSGPIWPRHQLKYDQDINFCLTMKKREKMSLRRRWYVTRAQSPVEWEAADWLLVCSTSLSLHFFQMKYLSDAIFVWCNICLFAPPVFLSTSFQMQLLSDALFDWNNICQLLSDFLFLMQYLSALSGFALCAAGKDVSELMTIVEGEWIWDCQGSTEKLY